MQKTQEYGLNLLALLPMGSYILASIFSAYVDSAPLNNNHWWLTGILALCCIANNLVNMYKVVAVTLVVTVIFNLCLLLINWLVFPINSTLETLGLVTICISLMIAMLDFFQRVVFKKTPVG